MKKRSCLDCIYAGQPSWFRSYRDTMACWPSSLECVNHVDSPGILTEVSPGGSCRNFRARRRQAVRTVPPEPPNDAIRYIALTQGRYAIVDAADYEWLSKYRWFAKGGRDGKYYAGRTEKGRNILMHREIMKPPPGMVVDHINANSLDNRRRNMRNCTPQQNTHNRRFAGNASGFAGVYPQGKRWRAMLQHDGEVVYCALFDDKVEAARARDRKAVELFGQFACLNFPEEHQATAIGPRAAHEGDREK